MRYKNVGKCTGVQSISLLTPGKPHPCSGPVVIGIPENRGDVCPCLLMGGIPLETGHFASQVRLRFIRPFQQFAEDLLEVARGGGPMAPLAVNVDIVSDPKHNSFQLDLVAVATKATDDVDEISGCNFVGYARGTEQIRFQFELDLAAVYSLHAALTAVP